MMKTWTEKEVKDHLTRSDNWVIKGTLAIYRRQTADEQRKGRTAHNNGIGFNAMDAEILSSFAYFYRVRGYLTQKQIGVARKRLMKYCKQLTAIANQNEAYKQAKQEARGV